MAPFGRSGMVSTSTTVVARCTAAMPPTGACRRGKRRMPRLAPGRRSRGGERRPGHPRAGASRARRTRSVDLEAASYERSADSPAIDSSATIDGLEIDFLRAQRPAGDGYDIGAYERGAEPNPGGGPPTQRPLPWEVELSPGQLATDDWGRPSVVCWVGSPIGSPIWGPLNGVPGRQRPRFSLPSSRSPLRLPPGPTKVHG
jgi:hypothetical protein